MVSCRKGLDKQRIKGLGAWGGGLPEAEQLTQGG